MTVRQRWLIRLALLAMMTVCLLLAAWLLWRGMEEKVLTDRVVVFHQAVEQQASTYQLPAALIYAVISVESSGLPLARSGADARGLMQVRPIAQQEVQRIDRTMPGGDLFDPVYNVRIGTAYLAHMMKRFDRDIELALAAYNAGPTRIAKLRRAHPDMPVSQLVRTLTPKETQAYVGKVLYYQDYWQTYLDNPNNNK